MTGVVRWGTCEGRTRARIMVLGRWWGLIGARRLAHEALHTLQGRLMLVVAVVAVPGLVELIRTGGPLADAALGPSGRVGALALAHLCLLATLGVMVAVRVVGETGLRREPEPLAAHPSFLPDLRRVRLLGIALGTSGFLTVFLHLFHLRTIGEGGPYFFPRVAVHAGSTVLFLSALGIPVAVLAARWVSARRDRERVRALHRRSVIPFAVVFPSSIYVPSTLARRWPEGLEALGGMVHRLGFVPFAPMGVSEAVASGAWAGVALWAGGIGAVFALGSGMLGRDPTGRGWAEPLESGPHRGRRRRARIRRARGGPRWIREVRLFWAKDVRTASRWRRGELRLHVELAGLWALAFGAVAWGAGVAAAEPSVGRAASHGILASVGASLGFVRGLPSLGLEGRRLGLLVPVLSPLRLLRAKALVNVVYGGLATAAHAVVALGVSSAFGLSPGSVFGIPAGGLLVGSVFGLLATSVGFLLPDLARRSTLLPGASVSGRFTYSLLAAGALGAVFGVSWMHGSSAIGTLGALAALGLVTSILICVAIAAGAWALRRWKAPG